MCRMRSLTDNNEVRRLDKYEYRVKTEQMVDYLSKKQFKKAMEIADTIDWRRVKNVSMLSQVGDIYEANGELLKAREILLLAFDRAPESRKTVYHLALIALKLKDTEEASDCYEEFVKLAPRDPNQYILKYRVLKAQGAAVDEQIQALEDFKKAEYVEKWAYELAKLYDEAGRTAECLEECDDLILWFSEGKYVYQAMELKRKYRPLTPLQKEKYDAYRGFKTKAVVEAAKPEKPSKSKVDAIDREVGVSQNTMSMQQDTDALLEALGGDSDPQTPQGSTIRIPTENVEEAVSKAIEETKAEEETAEGPMTEEPATEETAVEAPATEDENDADAAHQEGLYGKTIEELLAEADAAEEEESAILEEDDDLEVMTLVDEPEEDVVELALQEGYTPLAEEEDDTDELADEIAKLLADEDEEETDLKNDIEEIVMDEGETEPEEAEEYEPEETAEAEEEVPKKSSIVQLVSSGATLEEALRNTIFAMNGITPEEEKPEDDLGEEAETDDFAESEEESISAFDDGEDAFEDDEAPLAGGEDAFVLEEQSEQEIKAADALTQAMNKLMAKDEADDDEDVFDWEEMEDLLAGIPDERTGIAKEIEEAQGETSEEIFEEEPEVISKDNEAENREPEEESMINKDEELRLEGQMMIDDILADWEAKQQEMAAAIEKQRIIDEEKMKKERQALAARKEAERIEALQKEQEELERKQAERIAAKRAAAKKAAEEEAARKAAEEEAASSEMEDLLAGLDELPQEAKEEEPNEDFDEDEFDEADEFDEGELDDDFDEFEDDEDFDEDEFEDEDDFDDDELEDEDDFAYDDEYDDEYDEEEYDEDDDEFEEDEEFDEDDFDEEEEDDFDIEDAFDESAFEESEFEDGNLLGDDLPSIEEPEVEEDFDLDAALEIEPSEEEIQARINKSKAKGVPFDTGFVVTGRYDLSATSEIGLRAGLTEEQKKLFSYFVPVRGMSEQIVAVLDNDRRSRREGTSRTGNILVIGRKGSGKTVLAVDIVKAIQKQRNLKQGKVAIVTGESLNKKELSAIVQKLRGGAIIIEKAGKLNSRTIRELNMLMEKKTGEMLFVLEDQRKPLERILTANPEFKRKFNSKLELPIFINDELVTFGQTYAKENGYKLDEMGILALYSRIDVLQREDHAVSVAEVKEIMDEAIAHSQKANVKHFARRVFGRSTDESDRIILKEEDFKL